MKAKTFWCSLLFLTALQAVFSIAFAFTDPAAALPTDDGQAGELAKQIWNLFVTKQYALALGPVVALVVFGLKKYDVKIPKYGAAIDKFLDQPFVSFLLPTIVAAAGGAGTALAAHKPVVEVLAAVFQASMSAVFSYVGLKKLGEQREAGAAAAAEVTDKAKAIEELKKP
jgi:hypothetical protein